jgi:hypothetical protein
MPDHERLRERLEYLSEELTDIRMLLDELLHVLRHIDRNGLGVYDADSHWSVTGTRPPEVRLMRDGQNPLPPSNNRGEESATEKSAPESAGHRVQSQLFD